MINPTTRVISHEITEVPSRALQLFDPPAGAVYTIEATAQFSGIPRRSILVYCKHRLLSPLIDPDVEGYSFDGDGIRLLRRIEALRLVCGDDFPGIKIILDLTNELERLQAVVRFLSQSEWEPKRREASRQEPRSNSRSKATRQPYKRRK
jgi:hypothetical protein